MHFASELVRPRAQKRLTYGAQWELRIESAPEIEANLAGKDRAVMKPPSRHQGGGIEPGHPPPEAKWIAFVA
jgi:hypothetical protein